MLRAQTAASWLRFVRKPPTCYYFDLPTDTPCLITIERRRHLEANTQSLEWLVKQLQEWMEQDRLFDKRNAFLAAAAAANS